MLLKSFFRKAILATFVMTALFSFSSYGTSNNSEGNGFYKIVKPNGGEHFKVGSQCTVIVKSDASASAVLFLMVGASKFPLMDGTSKLDPTTEDSVFVFTIKEYYTEVRYDAVAGKIVTDTVYTTSDKCKIFVDDYSPVGEDRSDESDDYFTIEKDLGIISSRTNKEKYLNGFSQQILENGINLNVSNLNRECSRATVSLYNVNGKKIQSIFDNDITVGEHFIPFSKEIMHLAPGYYLLHTNISGYSSKNDLLIINNK